MSSTTNDNIYSVSQLNRLAKGLLEDHFPAVSVEGEISNFAAPGSGHWYLTLKDDKAQLRCAMFRGRNMLVRMRPKNGMRVLVRGRLSLYEGRGDYQLILDRMEETGAGALRRAFEELQARLRQEGLFEAAHKQAIPAWPRHLAVITSPTGAAIHDVLSVLARRFPALPVTIIPVPVQGEGAPARLVEALQLVNRRQGCLADVDLVLLTRGGGSLEDLWAFNDEALARALFASDLPVIAAVGHEVDFTIAEFVADVRAPTPSAAAELLSPDMSQYRQQLVRLANRLDFMCRHKLGTLRQDLARLARRVQHPGKRVQEHAQRLDDAERRMARATNRRLDQLRHQLRGLQRQLLSHAPGRRIRQQHQLLEPLAERLQRAMRIRLQQQRGRVQSSSHALHAISPLATLARGYSITQSDTGEIIRHYDEVNAGATIHTRLAQGSIVSIVQSGSKDPGVDAGD